MDHPNADTAVVAVRDTNYLHVFEPGTNREREEPCTELDVAWDGQLRTIVVTRERGRQARARLAHRTRGWLL